MPRFKPGQYLTFQLNIPGQDKPVIRCYSLSDRFHDKYYRVSIKKIPPPPKNPELPPELSSNYFHDELKTESILDVKGPSGKFYLNEDSDVGVVLIAGGVGLTPMISMVNTLSDGVIWRNRGIFWLETEERWLGFRVFWFWFDYG